MSATSTKVKFPVFVNTTANGPEVNFSDPLPEPTWTFGGR